MRTITTVKALSVLVLAASLTARAQGTNGATGGYGEGGSEGQRRRPSPEQISKHMMEKFDANKDGELEQAESTQALEFLRSHRPQGSGAGGPSQNVSGETHQGPPPADKVAAQMIAKFSSDKKGLTQVELEKALAARESEQRGNRGPRGNQSTGGNQAISQGWEINSPVQSNFDRLESR